MISNPPFGKHWGTEKKKYEFQQELEDPQGPYSYGTPSVGDSQSLFMMKLISKMEPKGSRIGIITNGSPLFTDEPSDSSKNLSDFRKWLVNEDLIETIIKLPKGLFFDTDIHTYIWILSNKKPKDRQNKVQLINGINFGKRLGRSLNKKTFKFDDKSKEKILDLYINKINEGNSKIIDGKDFLYKRIKYNYTTKGENKSEFDRIDMNIDSEVFFNENIKPFLPTSNLEPKKERIGCEITFNKYFYEYEKPKETNEWLSQIRDIEKEISKITSEVLDD
jgi:type I restriction enzyme M protein